MMMNFHLRLVTFGSLLLLIFDLAGGQNRIVGGRNADPQRFPYYTALIFNRREVVNCGGILITPGMILTAAHCVEGRGTDDFFVAVNHTDIDNLEAPGTYMRRPERIFIHPARRRSRVYNDVAIVQVVDDLPNSIPMPRINLFDPTVPNNTTRRDLTAVGLGTVSSISVLPPRFLQEVDVEYVHPDPCLATWTRANLFNRPPDANLEICAFRIENGIRRNVCRGDSGGPLIIRGRDPEEDVVVGITSRGFTRACGRFPELFVRMSSFKDWVQNTVCLNSDASTREALCDGFDSDNNPFSDADVSNFQFRANYEARFRHILGGGCNSGSKPVLEIECLGGQLDIQRTSSPSIRCFPDDDSRALCINTCDIAESSETPCSAVYLDRGFGNDMLFGSIFFRCESNDVENVGANFTIDPDSGTTGSCDGTSSLSGAGRNFRVGQLGIRCSDPLFGDGSFVFPDYGFECGLENEQGKLDGKYICYEGKNCGSQACDNIDFDPVSVTTDILQLGCGIESSDGSPIPPRAPPPLIDRIAGSYSARFRANWQLNLDIDCLTDNFPRITATCENGNIRLVDTIHETTKCNIISNNIMECTETDFGTFVNQYSSIIYECTATNAIPTTSVEYGDSLLTCGLALYSEKVNRQKLQLDIFCNEWTNSESLAECKAGNFFDHDGGVFTCFEQTIVPQGHEDETFSLGTTHIQTDSTQWSNSAPNDCFNFSP